jgi:hypothetical protein
MNKSSEFSSRCVRREMEYWNPELAGRGTVPLDAADDIDERQQSAAACGSNRGGVPRTRREARPHHRGLGVPASHSCGAKRCLVLVFACLSGVLCSWKKGFHFHVSSCHTRTVMLGGNVKLVREPRRAPTTTMLLRSGNRRGGQAALSVNLDVTRVSSARRGARIRCS